MAHLINLSSYESFTNLSRFSRRADAGGGCRERDAGGDEEADVRGRCRPMREADAERILSEPLIGLERSHDKWERIASAGMQVRILSLRLA